MLTPSLARTMCRRNGLSADLSADLLQESVLAELQGRGGANAAKLLAENLGRRSMPSIDVDVSEPLSEPLIDTIDVLALISAADRAFALSVVSGDVKNHGSANQRFSRIVKMTRTKLGLLSACMVSAE